VTPYAIILAFSAATCAFLAYISWRWRGTRGALVLAFLLLAIAEWELTTAFETAAVHRAQKMLWSSLSYLGVVACPPLLLIFVLRYSDRDKGLTPRLIGLMCFVPLVTVALSLTNEWHHLIWARVTEHPTKNLLLYDYGLWFWVWSGYAYCLLAVSTFLLLRMAIRHRHTYRLQAILLLAALVSAWIGNGLYLAKTGILGGRDLTPLGFAFAAALLVLNIYRFRLLDLVPMAREAVIENMDEGVLVLDEEDRVVDANAAALEILDLEASLIGQRIEEVLSTWPELLDVYCDGAEARCEVQHGGSYTRYLDVRLSQLYDRRGRFGGRLMVMSDITARKELEQQLRQAQKMEAIGRLAGGVAHEFNNLLTVINGYSEMSLAQLEEDDPVRADLEQVLESGRRAARLTNRLLTFSRRRAMKVEVVDPGEVLEEMVGMLQQVVSADIQLETEIADDVAKVRVDQGRLEETLLNLVANAQDAIRATEDGKGTISIQARNVDVEHSVTGHLSVEQGSYVQIEVCDTGAGMGADVQERMFEPFFTTKEVGEGTGLGLAIVYGTVEEFGGGIEVTSAPGEGTSIRIYLPRIE
jgi:PAS domain S-box-containing protein